MSESFLFILSSNLWKRFMNGRCCFFITAVALIGAYSPGNSEQFGYVSESRTDSASTSGTYGSPESYSGSNSTDGTFVDSQSASTSGASTTQDGGGQYPSDSTATATASQNSSIAIINVDDTSLSGSGSSVTSATLPIEGPSDIANASGSSTYSVSFTNSAPATLPSTGTFTGSSDYHEGQLGIVNSNVELTSTPTGQSSPVSVDYLFKQTNRGVADQRICQLVHLHSFPLYWFIATDQTYTFSVSVGTESQADQFGENTTSAGFNFNADVYSNIIIPEPSSLGILLVSGSLLIRRREEFHKHKLDFGTELYSRTQKRWTQKR